MNDKKEDELDEQVLANLADALHSITDMVSKTLKEDRYYPGFREDMMDVRKRIDKVVHVLHEGNGEKPLITRMSLAEFSIESLKEDVQELKETKADKVLSESAAIVSSRITMRGYIITGVIAGATAIIVSILDKVF
jgi:hypothetical protein